MSRDIKVYLSDRFDIKEKDTKMQFIDTYAILTLAEGDYDTAYSIEKYGVLFYEEPYDDRFTWNSYVMAIGKFEDKIVESSLKRYILHDIEKYRDGYTHIVCQFF